MKSMTGVCRWKNVLLILMFFLYAIDDTESEKQAVAQSFLRKLKTESHVIISTQVIQEYISITTKKFGFKKEDVLELVKSFSDFSIHKNDFDNIIDALKISIKTQFSFWDSLIISAAKSENCSILYSEDLSSGQIVDGIKIVNPFA